MKKKKKKKKRLNKYFFMYIGAYMKRDSRVSMYRSAQDDLNW